MHPPTRDYDIIWTMFKPIDWNTFPKSFMIAQGGFFLFGSGIALIIQAKLGTGSWEVLAVALSDITGLSPGMMIIFSGLVALVIAILLGEEMGWGTVGNMLFIGPWTDFFLQIIPSVEEQLHLRILMLLGSIALVGMASAIYISVDAGAGPGDSLMLAISRNLGWSVRLSRAILETLILIVGWIFGGPVGIGTVVFSLLIGPAIQFGFKLLDIDPHRQAAEPAP